MLTYGVVKLILVTGNMLPFKEEILADNLFIREFFQDTDSGEYMWHRDREDRIIKPLEKTNWQIQFDNELPIVIEGKIFVPMGVYHRVIKGDGNLKILLEKIK